MKAEHWERIEHFAPDEFDHPEHMEEALIFRLDVARAIAQRLADREKPGHGIRIIMQITSDLRPGDDGEHGSGEGIDLSDNLQGADVSSRWRYYVIPALYLAGFKRIGVYDAHVHVGVDDERDQCVMWWGKSQ